MTFLLEHGGDIDALDGGGESPLLKAVMGGHTALVEYLVFCGAEVGRRIHMRK